jgi:Fur family ferric uptake transcriptional regulator
MNHGVREKTLTPEQDAELKGAGLKATLPRVKVLEAIRGSQARHLSAEEVYRRLLAQGGDFGLATIYRVLAQLEEAGLLSRNVFDGGKAVYEINQGSPHDHLICLSCGRVDEFTSAAIEAQQREVAAERGYRLAGRGLVLYGHCADCGAVNDARD